MMSRKCIADFNKLFKRRETRQSCIYATFSLPKNPTKVRAYRLFSADGRPRGQSLFDPSNPAMARPLVGGISAAAAAGHAAFFCTGAAFLATDILHLRTISMGSISLAMVFQYYRPQPLRMPLRWNAIFLLINCGMAGALYAERQEAEDMTEEMVEIFEEGLFRDRGFSKVDFYRLFGLAKKEVIKKGDFLKRSGSVSNKLCVFHII